MLLKSFPKQSGAGTIDSPFGRNEAFRVNTWSDDECNSRWHHRRGRWNRILYPALGHRSRSSAASSSLGRNTPS